MIKVNLLPGGKKRAARGSGSRFGLPGFKSLPIDRWVLGGGAIALGALIIIGVRFQGIQALRVDLENRTVAELEDSVEFADLIVALDQLTARRDSVASRVQILQQVDLNRYLWSHVLDEVARAVPDNTWLTGVTETAAEPDVDFGIQGFAGSIPAVTVFMNNLEASPFLARVSLVSTQMVSDGEGGGAVRNIFSFSLQARYTQPPLDFLETAPLFTGGGVLPETQNSSDGGLSPMEG